MEINIHPSEATIDSDFEEIFGESIGELLSKGYAYYSDEENYRDYYFAISGNTISESEGNEIIKFDDSETIYSIVAYKHDETDPETGETISVDTISAVSSEPRCLFEKGSGENSVKQKGTGAVASGDNSVATGNGVASGNYSHSEGQDGEASGDWSHNEGGYTFAKGDRSHAEGNTTYAEGTNSHAEGINTHAYGQNSHTEGADTAAGDANKIDDTDQATGYGWNSHAEGNGSIARGSTSHAEGYHTRANGFASHTEGSNNIADASYAHVEGANNEDIHANTSHTEGTQHHMSDKAQYSHVEGLQNTLDALASHAEGARNVILDGAACGHAEGADNSLSGNRAHVEGDHNTTSNAYEHAEGHFNKSNKASATYGNAGNTQHSVGIGTGTGTTPRKNAFEIMQNGDAYLYGVGNYVGTNPTSGTNDIATIIAGKQETLISGTNIKTVNGNSLLGNGNLEVSGLKTLIFTEPIEFDTLTPYMKV